MTSLDKREEEFAESKLDNEKISDSLNDLLGVLSLDFYINEEGIFICSQNNSSKFDVLTFLSELFRKGVYIHNINKRLLVNIMDGIKVVSEMKIGDNILSYDPEEISFYENLIYSDTEFAYFDVEQFNKSGYVFSKDILFLVMIDKGIVCGFEYENISYISEMKDGSIIIASPQNFSEQTSFHFVYEKNTSPKIQGTEYATSGLPTKSILKVGQISDLNDPVIIRLPENSGKVYNIFGELISELDVKDTKLELESKCGNGTKIIENNGEVLLVAEKIGYLFEDGNGVVHVIDEPYYEGDIKDRYGEIIIDSDDLCVSGNIESNQKVYCTNLTVKKGIVYGSIQSNSGRIESGSVCMGEIVSDSGAIITRGRISNSFLRSIDGQIVVNYAENSTIVGSNITIKNAINCVIVGDKITLVNCSESKIHGIEIIIQSINTDKPKGRSINSEERIILDDSTNILVPVLSISDNQSADAIKTEEILNLVRKKLVLKKRKLEELENDEEIQKGKKIFELFRKDQNYLKSLSSSGKEQARFLIARIQKEYLPLEEDYKKYRRYYDSLVERLSESQRNIENLGDPKIFVEGIYSNNIALISYLIKNNVFPYRVTINNYERLLKSTRMLIPPMPTRKKDKYTSKVDVNHSTLREALMQKSVENREIFGVVRDDKYSPRSEFLMNVTKDTTLEDKSKAIKPLLDRFYSEEFQEDDIPVGLSGAFSSLTGRTIESPKILIPIVINGQWRGLVFNISITGIGCCLLYEEGLEKEIIKHDNIMVDFSILGEDFMLDIYVRWTDIKNGCMFVGGNFFELSQLSRDRIKEKKGLLDQKIRQIKTQKTK
ncbi:hypothetical protein [Candidatus Absconditicoccus praedator]|uniref:hypothetical protein n=1 Tax=Candidatus Absconditicoccus praedator TaxID=2735562 RepID=UPI001E6286AE|nr:hypothetical protein [Candidatus Absconditicoccus praedator]UFX83038.1 hypothetical protein HLG78_02785 [Candidatus Absconditicoccus praedator]